MNIQRIFSIFLILLVFSQVSFSQEASKTILTDEMENGFCTEDVRARIDNFIVTLQNNPQSEGYIIGHADSAIPGRFLKYYSAFQKHIVSRGFNPERVKFLRGENRDKMIFQLWLVPKGAELPKPSEEYKETKILSSTLFDKSHIRIIEKGEVFFGGEDEPCDWGLNLEEFAKTLKDDPDLIGYFLLFNNEGKDTDIAFKASEITINLLNSKHNIPKDRLAEVYGGVRKDRELELWLIPKGKVLPKIKNTISNPILIDHLRKPNCEFLLFSLDNFFVSIVNEPNSVGYAVIHGKKGNFLEGLFEEHRIAGNVNFRQFYKNRIKIIHGEEREELEIELWLVPENADKDQFKEIEVNLSYRTLRNLSFSWIVKMA